MAEREESDQYDQYYIDLSDKGKGTIYSMDRHGNTRLFAKDFITFLIKFFNSFSEYQEDSELSD